MIAYSNILADTLKGGDEKKGSDYLSEPGREKIRILCPHVCAMLNHPGSDELSPVRIWITLSEICKHQKYKSPGFREMIDCKPYRQWFAEGLK